MRWLDIVIDKNMYDRKPLEKRLSASQFGSSLYENLMVIKYGSLKRKEFGQDTIGTLLHKGIECSLAGEKGIDVEKELEVKLYGWSISGTADIIDHEEETIYDVKLTKNYKNKMLKEEIRKGKLSDSYIMQLNILRWLFYKTTSKEYDIKLPMLLKDGGWNYKAKEPIKHKDVIEVPKIPFNEIEKIVQNKIKEVMPYIIEDKNGIVDVMFPNDCDGKMQFGTIEMKSGKKVPAKCELYCSYKNICPAYRKNNETILDW